MAQFATARLDAAPVERAPDGCEVRVLLATGRGGMARFEFAPGTVSRAVRHRTVDEIWLVLAGQGEMWRRTHGAEQIVTLTEGTCVTIPAGTTFQVRTTEDDPLSAVGVTMPPWPGPDEAVMQQGRWEPHAPS